MFQNSQACSLLRGRFLGARKFEQEAGFELTCEESDVFEQFVFTVSLNLWENYTCSYWLDAPTSRGLYNRRLSNIGRAVLGNARGGMEYTRGESSRFFIYSLTPRALNYPSACRTGYNSRGPWRYWTKCDEQSLRTFERLSFEHSTILVHTFIIIIVRPWKCFVDRLSESLWSHVESNVRGRGREGRGEGQVIALGSISSFPHEVSLFRGKLLTGYLITIVVNFHSISDFFIASTVIWAKCAKCRCHRKPTCRHNGLK